MLRAGTTRSQPSELASGVNVGGRALYNGGLDASWDADLFGGMMRRVESAQRNEESAAQSYRVNS